jgi:hypothetical protein
MKNWKTTAAGLALAAISFATYMGWLSPTQAQLITTVLSGLGFIIAKDSGVSGKGH